MKKKLLHIVSVLFLFNVALFSLSSCIEDDWFDDDWWEDGGWRDDRRAESVIRGRWYVDRLALNDDNCPYYVSDEFNFYGDGYVEIYETKESGRWWVDNRFLLIDFDGDGRVDWEGYIDCLRRGYLALDVRDYDYRSKYYMELGR